MFAQTFEVIQFRLFSSEIVHLCSAIFTYWKWKKPSCEIYAVNIRLIKHYMQAVNFNYFYLKLGYQYYDFMYPLDLILLYDNG